MTAQSQIGQRGRLIILILYLAGLFVASRIALGSWLPPTSEQGLWFYAAFAALLLGSLLVTPFFTKPVDAISYAVAAIVALLAVNSWGMPNASRFDRFTWSAATAYGSLVLAAAFVAISLKDSSRSFARKLARSGSLLADTLGSPRAIFSVVLFYALITYHRASPREYLTISLAWALFVGLHPLETVADLWRRWRALWSTRQDLARLGEVVCHETPGLVMIQEDPTSSVQLGDIVLARNESGEPGLSIALDHVGFAGGRWRRAIGLNTSASETDALNDPAIDRAVSDGSAFRLEPEALPNEARTLAEQWRLRLIGFVASDTRIGSLQIELVRADLDLQEGSLVEVQIKGQPVLCQIIHGLTKEEVLREKNTRGFVRAEAKKIGRWNHERGGFDPVPWLPQPNQAVLLVSPDENAIRKEAIGRFPGTAYPVCVNPHLLVTHNAAILGILGVGKSFLALELVERMIATGIKVVCLDLTNQYATELSTFLDAGAEKTALDELKGIGPPGRTRVEQNVEEGGSVREFAAKVKEHFEAFLKPGADRKLKVLNPVEFEVWRQDSKPYQGRASMATLTPTEITRIITETLLEVLQTQGMTHLARCCVVYEEAHSLIPEWNAVASDGDKAATNGTAKAILQGRKFGLGCLVITQRTANVTKSILNQCNTVFGLRVFDATGMEFLKNYIGEDYAGVLSTLEDRHAVVFGRASSCRDPVLVRLNDRAHFIAAFRGAARQNVAAGQ